MSDNVTMVDFPRRVRGGERCPVGNFELMSCRSANFTVWAPLTVLNVIASNSRTTIPLDMTGFTHVRFPALNFGRT